jgi:hypothetical protein
VAAAFGWHALFVTVTGVVAGVAAGAVTLVAGAVMIPFWLMSRHGPALAAG